MEPQSICGNVSLFKRVCCCFMTGRTPAYLAGETEHLLGGVARTTPSEKERELANRYWAKAVDCHSRGELDKAVAQFMQAARLDGTRADILLHLGTALQDAGDLDDAASCAPAPRPPSRRARAPRAETPSSVPRPLFLGYRRVLALDADNHGALYNLGYIYEEQRRFSDAIKCFEDALRVAPRDSDAAINVGNCYMQMDLVTKAIATYESVVRDDDDCAIGHYNLGSALHARRDLDAAARHFSRTIALEPTYADAHFNLGIVHQELGQLADALTCYDAAAKLDEKLADAANAADFIRKNFENPANAPPGAN